jgi:hypothetical protein
MESYPSITLVLVCLATIYVFIIINDQNITFLGHTGPLIIVWALRTLCMVTIHLFENGGSKTGVLHPLPLILALSSMHIQTRIKISNLFKKLRVLCLHGIFMLPSSIFRIVAGPLNFYQFYNSILEHFDFFVQYPH